MAQANLVGKNISTKIVLFVLAAVLGLGVVYGFTNASVANAAFDQITVGGGVTTTTDLEGGLFTDMNTVLMVFLSIGGFAVIACLIFAGVKLATAQGNPQARTQGFIGLGMALLGGWVVYKALDLAGWIKGLS